MGARDEIAPEALAAELDRICESPSFRHSLRHQQFLRHLVACKLAGRFASLREMALGIEFFGRPASSYDPKLDAVVRIEAGRLRQRLDRYYHGEGIDAPLEITLDKGSYLPTFRARAPTAVRIGSQPSVAVLPLPAPTPPGSGDPELAAALTDEIVQTLARLPQVRVLGPESSIAAGVSTAPEEARRRLKVEWIVRATWSSAETRTLLLEVVSTGTGKPVFSQRIDAPAADALTLNQQVRNAVLHGFVPLLASRGGEPVPASSRGLVAPTHDLGAFDLYQRARYLLKQRNQAVLAKAIAHLESAVYIDPRFSAAWAELALAYVRRRQLVFDAAERDPARAKQAALQAVKLDPESGFAYAILAGLAYIADFDWPSAGALFAHALAASPRDPTVRTAFATFLMYSARFEESLREYDVVQALDPLDPAIRCNKGALYFYWRRYDRAETVLADALEMTPQDVYARLLLADSYAQSGRAEESLEASRELVAVAPDYANSYVYHARALYLLGRENEADTVMSQARARFAPSITEYEEAMLHMARGDSASALSSLERHALRRANGAHCMALDPTFAALHGDPRWQPMMERVGLPNFYVAL